MRAATGAAALTVVREPPQLHDDAVHIWQGRISDDAPVSALWHQLSSDEQARANDYRFAGPRHRFIVARALLRWILIHYLSVPAAEIAIRSQAMGDRLKGKPYLVKPEHRWLRFNVAHSGDVVLVAVAHNREVGVDVEALRLVVNPDYLMRTFFSEAERQMLTARAEPRRSELLLAAWTAKEAYGKALGVGVAAARDFTALAASPMLRTFAPQGCYQQGADRCWWLSSFEPIVGYVASIAVEAPAPSPAPWVPAMSFLELPAEATTQPAGV